MSLNHPISPVFGLAVSKLGTEDNLDPRSDIGGWRSASEAAVEAARPKMVEIG